MATVYRARARETGKPLALKVLHPQYAQDPTGVERFHREAATLAKLHHRNIVRVFDHGSDDGQHFLAMELLSGETLHQLLQREGPLPVERSVDLAVEILHALDSAWMSQRVVHRDLKPQNIMIDDRGVAKVMDFGIARVLDLPTVTRTGSLWGTPHYMSPEQARGDREIDIRSDLYAVGVILYEVLTGTLPFDSESPWTILDMQIGAAPAPPRRLRPDLPPPIERLILRALQKDPDERYQTPSEMLGAVAQARTAARQWSRWRWVRLSLATAAILALLVAGAVAWRSLQDELAQQRLRASEIAAEAEGAIQADDWAVALERTRQAWLLDPDNRELRHRLQWLAWHTRGETLFQAGDLEGAGAAFRAAAAVIPARPSTDSRVRTVEELSEAMALAERLLESGLPEKAVEVLNGVRSTAPTLERLGSLETRAAEEIRQAERAREVIEGKLELREILLTDTIDRSVEPPEPGESRVVFGSDESISLFVQYSTLEESTLTFRTDWIGPDGRVKITGRTEPIGQERGFIGTWAPSVPAADVDPEATGEPSYVILYVDDAPMAVLTLSVAEG